MPPDPTTVATAAQDEWRKQLPDSLREKPIEEIVNWGLSAHKQVGALNNDLGTYKKMIEERERELQQQRQHAQTYEGYTKQWTDWWKQFEPEYQAWDKGRKGGEPVPQPGAGDEGDPFSKWDSLGPRDQARALQEMATVHVGKQFDGFRKEFSDRFTTYQKQVQDYIGGQVNFVRNYLTVWQKAWEAKQRDPSLDIDRAVEAALKFAQGQVDPLELGIRSVTAERDREAYGKQLREQWDGERKAEDEKKRMQVPTGPATPPTYKLPPKSAVGPAGRKESAAKALAEKFGAGIF